MNYGKIYITTKDWQTGTDIEDYKDGTVYFSLFGERCKCNLYERVVYHSKNGTVWHPFERAGRVVDVRAPEIIVGGET